jgi:hypothetical protein
MVSIVQLGTRDVPGESLDRHKQRESGTSCSLTNNLLIPLLAGGWVVDPASRLYLGKAEFNIPAPFKSVLALRLAGIVFVLTASFLGSMREHA